MNYLKGRVSYLLVVSIAAVSSGVNEGTCQSSEDAESVIRFVPKDATTVVVIRPRQLTDSAAYRQLAGKNPNMHQLIERLNRDWFKFGLAEFQDIEYLAQVQNRIPKQPDQGILVLKTVKDHADGFDIATHSSERETEFKGKTIIESKKPLLRIYKFACIFDEKTIVWGNRRESVESAIETAAAKSIAVEWYPQWKQFEEHDVGFAMIPDSKAFPPAPHTLARFSEVEQFFGGVELESDVTVTIHAVCATSNKAKEISPAAVSALAMAKQFIDSQMTKDVRSYEQAAYRILLKLIDAAQIGHDGKIVRLNSKAKIDFGSILDGLDEMLAEAKRIETSNNLRQGTLAMHNYYSAHGRFPPSVLTHESGKKYSWRIAILPYIEQQEIYDRYDFTQDWDSPHNLKVTADMPDLFRGDSDDEYSTNASFFMLTGPGGVFDGETALDFPEMLDGSSNTVIAVEAKRNIHWAKPEDIMVEPGQPFPDLGGFHEGGFNVTMADGSVRFLSEDIAEETLRRLFLAGDGQVIDPDELRKKPATRKPDGR